MDKLLLKMLLAFIKVFAKDGVDFERLKIITETKILMDRRRSPATFRRKQRKDAANPLLITLIMYTILGIFMSLMIANLRSITLSMIFMHSYLIFFMAMTLITDFSSVLLDTADSQIILPKPVTSRTLFLARVVHILVYLLQFTIALTVFPLITTFVEYGPWVGLTMLATMFFTVGFSVFITYLLYALILHFSSEQKMKDVISYFQIFMTVFFAVGYQIIPRLINFEKINNMNFSFHMHWYSYLLPPVWMAMTLEAIDKFNFDQIHLLMIALAVTVPVLTVWFMVKYLAPSFSRKIAALSNNNEDVKKISTGNKNKKNISQRLSAMICSSSIESAGFEKVWKITGRDKGFKMQFYPSLAYLFIFAFIFIFQSGKNIVEIWHNLPQTKMFLWLVYLPMFSISSALNVVAFNENYMAVWIYQAVPLKKPGQIISGSLKVILVKFFVPVYLVVFSLGLYIWGNGIIDDFVFGFFNNIMIFLLIANLSDHYLPFSSQPNVKAQSGKLVRVILQLIIISLLIGGHYLALKIYWLPLALIPVSCIIAYLLLKRIQELPWIKIAV